MATVRAVQPQDRPIPLASVLALFAPKHLLAVPQAMPLHLMECVPGSLKKSVRTDENGDVIDPEDRRIELVLSGHDGTQCRILTQGHQKLGLPRVSDWAGMFGILSLAQSGRANREGWLEVETFAELAQAAGKNSDDKRTLDWLKTVIRRFGAIQIECDYEFGLAEYADRVRNGKAAALIPGAYPEHAERTRNYWVLNYDIINVKHRSRRVDVIRELQINPVWLQEAVSGVASWVELDVYFALTLDLARALYQRMLVRVSRDQVPRWVAPYEEILSELGPYNRRRPSQHVAELSHALDQLREHGIVEHWRSRELGNTTEFRIEYGERLMNAYALRGAGLLDGEWVRMVFRQMALFDIQARTARELVESYPQQVVPALRYGHYLRLECDGRDLDGPVHSWGGWLRRNIERGRAFDQPEFVAWVERMDQLALDVCEGRVALPQALDALSGTGSEVRGAESPAQLQPSGLREEAPAPEAKKAEPEPLPDDVWGQARERFRARITEQAFETWLRPTHLVAEREHTLVVGTSNPFAMDWIRDKYAPDLEPLLEELLGRSVQLQLIHEP